jgi:hypothetical protein
MGSRPRPWTPIADCSRPCLRLVGPERRPVEARPMVWRRRLVRVARACVTDHVPVIVGERPADPRAVRPDDRARVSQSRDEERDQDDDQDDDESLFHEATLHRAQRLANGSVGPVDVAGPRRPQATGSCRSAESLTGSPDGWRLDHRSRSPPSRPEAPRHRDVCDRSRWLIRRPGPPAAGPGSAPPPARPAALARGRRWRPVGTGGYARP